MLQWETTQTHKQTYTSPTCHDHKRTCRLSPADCECNIAGTVSGVAECSQVRNFNSVVFCFRSRWGNMSISARALIITIYKQRWWSRLQWDHNNGRFLSACQVEPVMKKEEIVASFLNKSLLKNEASCFLLSYTINNNLFLCSWQETGQCFCKPNACSGTCSTCKDGYYNLQEQNYFGCQGESSPDQS